MKDEQQIYDVPSEVTAVDGHVEMVGPDDVDVAFTPDAAEETSDRLLRQSFRARGSKRLDAIPHRPDE